MAEAYADARENAAEETGVPRAELPEHCPWTLEGYVANFAQEVLKEQLPLSVE